MDIFRSTDDEIKHAIAKLSSPMIMGLCILAIAQDKHDIDYLSSEDIVEALDEIGVFVKPSSIINGFNRAGENIRTISENGVTKYKIGRLGKEEVKDIVFVSGPKVMYIESGSPYTAHRKLEELFSSLNGCVRICDTWYGERSTDVLKIIPSSCDVRFLTARTNEDKPSLHRSLQDFIRENPHIKIKLHSNPRELHDRYIVTQDVLLIVGQGLKDIGKSESFVIMIESSLMKDTISTIVTNFDGRWNSATPI